MAPLQPMLNIQESTIDIVVVQKPSSGRNACSSAHNVDRSQMAQRWLRHLAGDAIEVRSAGSKPAGQINAMVDEAVREIGIDITAEQPKILTGDAVDDLRRGHHHPLR